MQRVVKTFIFHIMCILFFTTIYDANRSFFKDNNTNNKALDLVDFLTLSTTIQAGVGYSNIYPLTYKMKFIMLLQQLLMISTNIFTIYIFTM